MVPSLVFETKSFAIELHSLLKDLDPVRWQRAKTQAFKERVLRLEQEVFRLYGEMQHRSTELVAKMHQKYTTSALRDKLHRVGELLTELKHTHGSEALSPTSLKVLRPKLETAYQELSLSMEAYAIQIPQLRPTNYMRSLFHIMNALVTLFCIQWFGSPETLTMIAVCFALFCWSMESLKQLSRRVKKKIMAFFSPVAHAHEHNKVNSATWYATGLVFLSLPQNPLLATIGVMVLGLADPAAALVGRRFGRTPLVGNRSLEGSLSFFVVGVLITCALMFWLNPLGQWWQNLAVGAFAGFSGAIGELMGSYPDDNMTIPLASAAGAWLAFALF